MDAAITSAFMDDSEEAWEALLEATGAAHHDDSRAEAPAIDVQHSSTGALTPSLPWARTGGLADVRPVHDRRNTPETKHSSGDLAEGMHALTSKASCVSQQRAREAAAALSSPKQ